MGFSSDLHQYHKLEKGQIVPLLDPENWKSRDLIELCHEINDLELPYVMVGGSSLNDFVMDRTIDILKEYTRSKVILFPGNGFQLSNKADGILFLSLISSRNPEFIIGKQFEAAPLIQKMDIESIPTAYILIGDRADSSTAYVTQSLPIPSKKTNLIQQTALTGKMLGFQCLYLEGGSGSKDHISPNTIYSVRKTTDLPIIIGGGIRTAKDLMALTESGASMIVVGNILEEEKGFLKRYKQLNEGVA